MVTIVGTTISSSSSSSSDGVTAAEIGALTMCCALC